VAVPVAIGVGTGHEVVGLTTALGSLNVALSEGVRSDSSRDATLVGVLVLNAVSVAMGTLAAMGGWWAVPILMAWAFVGAYVGVIGLVAERIGWFAALMFMIGLGLADPSAVHAAWYAALVALGGAWAIVVITVLRPFHPHRPVMQAWGRSLLSMGDLMTVVRRRATGTDLERPVAHAEARGHRAGAVVRGQAVHSGHGAPGPERAKAQPIACEQALTDPVVLVDEVQNRDDRPDAAAATRPVVLANLSDERDRAVVGDESLIHQKPVPAGAAPEANLTVASLWFCYALRFSLAAGIGLSLSRSLGLEKGYWVLITIAAVAKPQLSLSTTATIHRVGGTLLGAVLGILVIISLSSRWGLVAALFVLTVIGTSLIQVNYGIAVVFITPLVLVLLNVAQPGHWQLAGTRVVDSLLGAGIGLLATTAILPRSEGGLVGARIRIALHSSARYLRAIGHRSSSQRLL
jgi:uncharacterized membrane protein YccC